MRVHAASIGPRRDRPEPRAAPYRPVPVIDRAGQSVPAAPRARFEALFAEYQRPILAYAMRRTRILDDAEDATAETFTIAWRRLATIPADAPLPWLYGVARRVLANQRRGRTRRERLASLLRDTHDVPTPLRMGDDMDGPAFAALASLAAADQELLRLVAWEGLGNQAIAHVLGITPNAVAIRLHRARARYAAALSRTSGTDGLKYPPESRTSMDAKGTNGAARKGAAP